MATSVGDVFEAAKFPGLLFNRAYRGKTFVAYNLKYDSGAFVQHLPKANLRELWEKGSTFHGGYRYKAIAYKCFVISRGKNSVTFYDMLNFYGCSLAHAAEKYLGKTKLDSDVTAYTRPYIEANWNEIAAYCVQDAVLVKELAELIIRQFESLGVYPRKLYSTAYVTYEYFRKHTAYVTVRRYWDKYRDLLNYAMLSYNGGKFEVTEKGVDHYWEYDIVSAYPFEIANLVDISYAKAIFDKHYQRDSIYGFLKVRGKIPSECHPPCAYPNGTVNRYTVGPIDRVITKREYDYLTEQGADLEIEAAWWLIVKYPEYPYKREIERLVKLKQKIKHEGNDLEYHTIKILLNSLYGKFVQLIRKGKYWHASTCWNPIYGSIITANTRVRVSEMQQRHPEVVAVHTDSIISVAPLNLDKSDTLGEFSYETDGVGVILGSGIYQVGSKVAFRGFETNLSLWDLLTHDAASVPLPTVRPHTWRSVAHRGWTTDKINLFEEIPRELKIRFDTKRVWFDDWQTFREVEKRKVYSAPIPASRLLL